MLLLPSQVKDLEQSLRASEEKLKESAGVAAAREAQIQELVGGDVAAVFWAPDPFPFCLCRCPKVTPNFWNGFWTRL